MNTAWAQALPFHLQAGTSPHERGRAARRRCVKMWTGAAQNGSPCSYLGDGNGVRPPHTMTNAAARLTAAATMSGGA